MKEFLKKYIGLILGVLMVILLIMGYFIEPNNPKLGHILSTIPVWYVGFIILAVILLGELKFLIWYDKLKDKLLNKIFKKWKTGD